MARRLYLLPLFLFMLLPTACSRDTALRSDPPETAVHVDLRRYAGQWYEIARYPNRFQSECGEATATYTLENDGSVTVVNRCQTSSGIKEARGTARVSDQSSGNARLRVSFFRPFYGDYWILHLGTDYDHAAVGTPDRKYLWILSRTPSMDAELYRELLQKMRARGFDPERLLITGKVIAKD